MITDRLIRLFRDTAGAAGDLVAVRICDAALGGTTDERPELSQRDAETLARELGDGSVEHAREVVESMRRQGMQSFYRERIRAKGERP
jgi:hypothetical protein